MHHICKTHMNGTVLMTSQSDQKKPVIMLRKRCFWPQLLHPAHVQLPAPEFQESAGCVGHGEPGTAYHTGSSTATRAKHGYLLLSKYPVESWSLGNKGFTSMSKYLFWNNNWKRKMYLSVPFAITAWTQAGLCVKEFFHWAPRALWLQTNAHHSTEDTNQPHFTRTEHSVNLMLAHICLEERNVQEC